MFGWNFGKKEPAATLWRSVDEFNLKQASNNEAWGLAQVDRWDADLDKGVISFSSEGQLVTAPVQVIGTYNSLDGTWLWGWDHPSVKGPLSRDALLARDFGERYRLDNYITPKIACTEVEAWEFTALACHLAGAVGAYRGPADTTFVFMTFHEVTILKRG